MNPDTEAFIAEARLCGSVYEAPDGDCLCLEPEHDEDVPHVCHAPGCGRQWATLNLGGDAA